MNFYLIELHETRAAIITSAEKWCSFGICKRIYCKIVWQFSCGGRAFVWCYSVNKFAMKCLSLSLSSFGDDGCNEYRIICCWFNTLTMKFVCWSTFLVHVCQTTYTPEWSVLNCNTTNKSGLFSPIFLLLFMSLY